jgi:hypothetical protein
VFYSSQSSLYSPSLIYNQYFNFQTIPTTPKSTTPKTAATPKAIPKAKTTPKAKKDKGGRCKAGAQNFNDEDKEFLIILLEEIYPIGPKMWDQVVSHYNDKYAEPNQRTTHDKDGLCTQYYKMYKTAKPMGDPTCPEYVQHAKKLKYEIEDEVVMTGIDNEVSESAASNIEVDEEPEPEANNADDMEDNTKSNTIEDNTESNTTENDSNDNIQADSNDDEYNGTDCMVTIAIKSDITSSTVIQAPPSAASQACKPHQKPSEAKEDNIISAILKLFDPEVQAVSDECLSAERFICAQLFDYKQKVDRLEGKLKDAKELIEKLRCKISHFQIAQIVAELIDRKHWGKKYKASAMVMDSDEEDNEESDNEDNKM